MKRIILVVLYSVSFYLSAAYEPTQTVSVNSQLLIILSSKLCKTKKFNFKNENLHRQQVARSVTTDQASDLCQVPDFLIYMLANSSKDQRKKLKPNENIFLHLIQRSNQAAPFTVMKIFKYACRATYMTQVDFFLDQKQRIKSSGAPWLLSDLKRILPDVEMLIACGLFSKVSTPRIRLADASLPPDYQEEVPPPYSVTAAAALPSSSPFS